MLTKPRYEVAPEKPTAGTTRYGVFDTFTQTFAHEAFVRSEATAAGRAVKLNNLYETHGRLKSSEDA